MKQSADGEKGAMPPRETISREAVVLEDEQVEEYEEMARNIRTDLEPENSVEALLVDRIIDAAWRLKRLARIEAEQLTKEAEALRRETPYNLGEAFRRTDTSVLNKYESFLEKGFYQALKTLFAVREKTANHRRHLE